MFFLSQPSHLYRYLLFRVDVMIRERCPAKWWTQAYLHPLQVTQVLPQDLMTRSGLCQLVKPFTQVPSSSDSPRPIHLPLIETSLRISCPPAPTPQPTAVCTSVNVPCVHHHGHTFPPRTLFSPDSATPWSVGSPYMGPFPLCFLDGLSSSDEHLMFGLRQD